MDAERTNQTIVRRVCKIVGFLVDGTKVLVVDNEGTNSDPILSKHPTNFTSSLIRTVSTGEEEA